MRRIADAVLGAVLAAVIFACCTLPFLGRDLPHASRRDDRTTYMLIASTVVVLGAALGLRIQCSTWVGSLLQIPTVRRTIGAAIGGGVAALFFACFSGLFSRSNPLLTYSGEVLIAYTVAGCLLVVGGAWLGTKLA